MTNFHLFVGRKQCAVCFKILFNIRTQFAENSTKIHHILGILHDPILSKPLKHRLISQIEPGRGVKVLVSGAGYEEAVEEGGDVDADGSECEPG